MTAVDVDNRPATSQPYGDAYEAYWNAGWRGILPVNLRSKIAGLPRSWTGDNDNYPSYADVHTWAETRPGSNLILRMPPTVVGIDVDDYKDKHGQTTLEAAEAQWGPLPPTISSTSRGPDQPSRILLFRIPAGVELMGQVQVNGIANIEIVQRRHRFVVAWPSVHPEGRTYEWYAVDGSPLGRVPSPDELPELPVTWQEGLKRDASIVNAAPAEAEEVRNFIASLRNGEPCTATRNALERSLQATRNSTGSRHDATRGNVLALLRLNEQGHHGLRSALTELRAAFIRNVGEDRPDVDREFDSMVFGPRGVGLILAQPTADSEKGCRCRREYGDDFIAGQLEEIFGGPITDWGTMELLREHVRDDEHLVRLGASISGFALARPNDPVAAPKTSPAPPVPKSKLVLVDYVQFTNDDVGNGNRFVARYGGDVAYVPEADRTRVWTGSIWEDDGGSRMRRLAEAMTEEMRIQANRLVAKADAAEKAAEDDQAKLKAVQVENAPVRAYAKWVGASRFESRLKACVNSARSHHGVEVRVGQWDAKPRLLNVDNGTLELDLDGGVTLREHRPEDHLTQQASANYNSQATCPQFDRYLQWALPSSEVCRVVRALAGLTLVGDNEWHLLPIVVGRSRSGKSTLAEVIGRLLDNADNPAASYAGTFTLALLRPKKDGNAPSPDLVRVLGKRFIWCSEAADGIALNADQVKRFTGGDRQSARDAYGKAGSIVDRAPAFVPWVVTNNTPRIDGADEALMERIVALPFGQYREPSERDPHLVNKIMESEASGVLNWALAGYADVMRNPAIVRDLPAECAAAAKSMHQAMSVYERWLDERTEPCLCEDSKECMTVAESWSDFANWADDSREESGTKRAFGDALVSAKYPADVAWRSDRAVRIRPGLKFNEEATAQRRRGQFRSIQGGAGEVSIG